MLFRSTGATDCGSYLQGVTQSPACHYSHRTNEKGYKAYNKTTNAYIHYFDDGILSMQDGTSIYFENHNALGNDTSVKTPMIFISVDINGYLTQPNVWGIDMFTWQIVDGELLPMGAKGTYFTNENTYCNPKSNADKNGIACTVKAKDNADYFKNILK